MIKNILVDEEKPEIYSEQMSRHLISILCSCGKTVSTQVEGSSRFLCPYCDNELFKTTSFTGYLYILINHSIPNLVKIGFTARSVSERVKEISSGTGVPKPFLAVAIFPAVHGVGDELLIHTLLKSKRLKNREFFELSPRHAISEIEKELKVLPLNVDYDLLSEYEENIVDHAENLTTSNQSKAPESVSFPDGICPKCKKEMRTLKKGGWKCRSCGTIIR